MIMETLYNAARDLFGIFSQLDEKKIQRKIRIADYFSQLAQTIEDTSAMLKKGVYPHGECAELHYYADRMVDSIGDAIGQTAAQDYQNRVLAVWRIEGIFDELKDIADSRRMEQLKTLDEAAGYFRGIAAHLRVSP
jgi:hypothetical protein